MSNLLRAIFKWLVTALVPVALISSSAATAKDKDDCKGTAGTIIGGVAGVMLGVGLVALSGGKKRLAVGAAIIGGGLGALLGRSIDQRRCRLRKIAKANKLDMQITEIAAADVAEDGGSSSASGGTSDSSAGGGEKANSKTPATAGLVVSLRDDGRQFEVGSDKLTADAEKYFGAIADTYAAKDEEKALGANATEEQKAALYALQQRVILLVGHTDDVGDSAFNAALSERRARAVAALFRTHGVPEDKIYFQGAGEMLPIDDNRTDSGRARNRRVEILDLVDTQALASFLNKRIPRVENYRPVEVASSAAPEPEMPAVKAPRPIRARHSEARRSPPPAAVPAAHPPTVTARRSPPPPKLRLPASQASAELDFGGRPAQSGNGPDIGQLVRSRGISAFFIPSAHAATLNGSGIASCAHDRPRYAYAVKSLRTGSPLAFSTGDFMTGLYDTSWSAMAGPHLVALTHVNILRDGGVPATRPTLMVFANYPKQARRGLKPSLAIQPHVNVYRGERGVLFRVFAGEARNMRCIDMVLPPAGGFSAPMSTLSYTKDGRSYLASWAAKIARK